MVNYSVSKLSLVAASTNSYYFSNILGYKKSCVLFTRTGKYTVRTMSHHDFGLCKFRVSFMNTTRRSGYIFVPAVL